MHPERSRLSTLASTILPGLFLALSLCLPMCRQALAVEKVSVGVNASQSVMQLTEDQVKDLFMGKKIVLPGNATRVVLFDCPDKEIREAFYQRVAKKTDIQMRAYWTRMQFTGEGIPPKKPANTQELREKLGTTEGAVGYCKPEDMQGQGVRPVWESKD